jgi:hypothetical protein
MLKAINYSEAIELGIGVYSISEQVCEFAFKYSGEPTTTTTTTTLPTRPQQYIIPDILLGKSQRELGTSDMSAGMLLSFDLHEGANANVDFIRQNDSKMI